MKDNLFDQTIRRKLETLRPPYRPEYWEEFEQHLDAIPGGMPAPGERSIDETAFRRLHQFEVPYRASSWERFAGRLDKEFVRPGQVMRIKAMELFMLLLLMLTLWQSLPYSPGLNLQQAGGKSTKTEVVSPKPEARDAQPRAEMSVGPPSESRQHGKVTTAENNNSGFRLRPSSVRPRIRGGYPRLAASGPAFRISDFAFSPSAEIPKDKAGAPGFALPPPAEAPKAMADAPHLALRTSPLIPDAPLLPARQAGPVEEETHPGNTVGPALLAHAVPRYFFFGMFGSLDYNRIVTPSDYFLGTRLNEFDRYELGYSGGFSLGFATGRWEFQTGAIYSAKHYRPVQLLYQYGNSRDGYVTEQLKDVQLNILHLPVNFRYNFLQDDRWRVYAVAGASLQVAIQANYYIEREGNSRRSVLNRYIDNGWFEGGTFTENSYLTGNLGLGVERTLTTRWSFFAQPTYQHAISFFNQGLGPTRDRISTLSVFTGIRVRIER